VSFHEVKLCKECYLWSWCPSHISPPLRDALFGTQRLFTASTGINVQTLSCARRFTSTPLHLTGTVQYKAIYVLWHRFMLH